jgi:hypothetical protein
VLAGLRGAGVVIDLQQDFPHAVQDVRCRSIGKDSLQRVREAAHTGSPWFFDHMAWSAVGCLLAFLHFYGAHAAALSCLSFNHGAPTLMPVIVTVAARSPSLRLRSL